MFYGLCIFSRVFICHRLVFDWIIVQDSFFDFQFTQAEVLKHIMSLYNILSSGPDDIPAIIVKQCAKVLKRPLGIIFKRSLEAGHFASSWKFGARHNVENYRPISLLNVFPKVFESLIKEKIADRVAYISIWIEIFNYFI